jgi:hypothetical protein
MAQGEFEPLFDVEVAKTAGPARLQMQPRTWVCCRVDCGTGDCLYAVPADHRNR